MVFFVSRVSLGVYTAIGFVFLLSDSFDLCSVLKVVLNLIMWLLNVL